MNKVTAKHLKRNVSGTLAFADSVWQKQHYTAALKQPLSLCKGYQKLQMSQAGQAHSLHPARVRGAHRVRGAEVSPVPKALRNREGDVDISQSSCWQGVLGKEWRGLLWLPGSMDNVPGDLQDHVLSGKYGPVARAGNLIHTHIFLYSPPREQVYLQSTSAAGKEHPLPFTAGECRHKYIIDFSKVTEPDRSSRILVWSADQSLNNTKQSSLQLQGHNVCGLVPSQKA